MANKNLVAALISLSMLLTIGCDKKEDASSTADYNQMVEKYNDLVKKYNAQTGRNVKSDSAIQLATLNLKELDEAVLEYRNALEITYRLVDTKQCRDASSTIDGVLKDKLEVITTKANSLAQGTLVKALNRMAGDLSSYKDDSHDGVRANIMTIKEQMNSGLTGIKSFALFSHNELIGEYNESCVRERTATVSRPDISEDSVVTVDKGGRREIINRDELITRYRGTYSENAYKHFSDIASGSGGFVGFSPTPEMFSQTVDVVLQSILEKSGSQTDVAIVLDTTSSMSDDISNVKRNMGRLLEKLKEKSSSIGLRLSLILYRDKGDDYLVRIAQDFTSDITIIDTAIQTVTVAGGGDEPEAVVDALDKTMRDLSWRSSASRSVVLIGDAPGHPSSHSGLSTTALVDNYKRAGLGIIVYPILVSK